MSTARQLDVQDVVLARNGILRFLEFFLLFGLGQRSRLVAEVVAEVQGFEDVAFYEVRLVEVAAEVQVRPGVVVIECRRPAVLTLDDLLDVHNTLALLERLGPLAVCLAGRRNHCKLNQSFLINSYRIKTNQSLNS